MEIDTIEDTARPDEREKAALQWLNHGSSVQPEIPLLNRLARVDQEISEALTVRSL